MKLQTDYHMHTKLCGHAIGEPADYAHQALNIGLKEIGFSDHAPLVCHDDPTVTMSFEQLPLYHKMIQDVQKQFASKLDIKLGIEADFVPGYEKQTKNILDSFPYDYVIGSVHFIKEWAFDDPDELEGWDHVDTNKIYRQYYEYLQNSARSGMFDIIGHVDLVKKFGHRPSCDMTAEIEKTAQIFKETGIVIEINTSGLRKPVKEIYPSLSDLKIYSHHKIPITFGSDSHTPDHVGADFDKAHELALAAGYSEYVTFERRKIKRTIRID